MYFSMDLGGMKIPLRTTQSSEAKPEIGDQVRAAKQSGQERLTNGVFTTNCKNARGRYHGFEIGMFRVSNASLHQSCKEASTAEVNDP